MLYLNGQFVNDDDAKISVLDLGLLRGYGVFDYLRTYEGRPFHLEDHLLRLKYSAELVGMTLPLSFEEIRKIIETLLEKNGYPESGIKILLTGGTSPDQMTPAEESHLIILTFPFKPLPPEDYCLGIQVTTTVLTRSFPKAKTLQYTPAIVALQQGKSKKSKEALYLNASHEILEGTTSNFFGFSQEGMLITCSSDEILLGVTREVVLQLAQGRFPLQIRSISLKEVPTLSECFITSSNREIMPVVKIDDMVIGNGQVGPKTQQLIDCFRIYTQQKSWNNLSIQRYSL